MKKLLQQFLLEEIERELLLFRAIRRAVEVGDLHVDGPVLHQLFEARLDAGAYPVYLRL